MSINLFLIFVFAKLFNNVILCLNPRRCGFGTLEKSMFRTTPVGVAISFLVFKYTPDFGRGSVGYTTGFAQKPTGASEHAFSKTPTAKFFGGFLVTRSLEMKRTLSAIFVAAALFGVHFDGAFGWPCPERMCSYEEVIERCGGWYPDVECAITDMLEPGCEARYDACRCYNNLDHIFIYGKGCVCREGKYSIYTGGECYDCPDGGMADSVNNIRGVSGCYKTGIMHSDSAHATVGQICYNTGFDNNPGSYSNCTVSYIISCDPGYYRPTPTSLSCVPVGGNYYSVSPLSRALCPTYTNPSGGQSYGITTGSGTGADAITDCAIPPTEVFNDGVGTYNYPGCWYS